MPRKTLLSTFAVWILATGLHAQAPKTEPGLVVTYTAAGSAREVDVAPAQNLQLYVSAGQPVSPFVGAGKFSAVYTGFVVVDLRGDYVFRAELNGQLKLEVGTNTVLDVSGDGKAPCAPSKPIRLSKGGNALKATFTSPGSGDAMLRVQWSEKGALWEPIPITMLTRPVGNAELKAGEEVRMGRELFFEHRCGKCHIPSKSGEAAPELAMDAPDLEGIGSRRGAAWMAAWILDPKSQRITAHMPRLLQGPEAKATADAMAAYLASLKSATNPAAPASSPKLVESGRKLAEGLHCTGCHNLPGVAVDPKKFSLQHVSRKFSPGWLADFIRRPDAFYAWTRMPHFPLSDDEAGQLAAYVLSGAEPAEGAPAAPDASLVEKGKQLVQGAGCLNCHNAGKLENNFKARPLADLAVDRWGNGCMGTGDSKAPNYGFNDQERAALKAFGATDRSSLARHSVVEFADRQTRALNCAGCHGQLEGFPVLPIIGGKLKPEWMKAFIAGEVKEKPRPWLEARMPAFPKRAEMLAHGLAMSHGLPPQTPPEPPIEMELTKIGQKLISSDGGFSCISCHGIGTMQATQVFESAGINFAYSSARLQRSYYERWVLNPLKVDSTTKMPVYFDDEGKSPLADTLDGSAEKQLNAIWQYIRLGNKMEPPVVQ